jgi:hypothetical protein
MSLKGLILVAVTGLVAVGLWAGLIYRLWIMVNESPYPRWILYPMVAALIYLFFRLSRNLKGVFPR